ncbi:hypothetical protein [Paraburkholderia sp. J94]|uniref:hypothetical protein n=1 Tax=Paraburkholderia sp. J94 TaxID=2805441 RepID=UPI0039F0C34E
MEAERVRRVAAFSGFQVDQQLLSGASQHVLIHCIPAHPSKEIIAVVLRRASRSCLTRPKIATARRWACCGTCFPEPPTRGKSAPCNVHCKAV